MKRLSTRYLFLFFSCIIFPLYGQNPTIDHKYPEKLKPNSVTQLTSAYSLTSCGLNYTSGSLLLCKRPSAMPFKGSNQPAALTISGIPVSASIDKAFLWWDILGQDTAGRVIITNPGMVTDTIKGVRRGKVYDPCSDNFKMTFRADVTAIVSGNGSYLISGLPLDTAALNADDTDGATLFIIYKDSTASFKGTILIYDGAVMVDHTSVTQNITGLTVSANINVQAFMIVSDMENKPGNGIKMNNGSFVGFTQNFWDYQEKPSALLSGQTTSSFGVQMPNECGNFLMMGLYYQTAVTPVIPTITQNADTLISSTALTYQWNFNNSSIPTAKYKKYLIQHSGIYRVITSYSGSNCYYASSPQTLLSCRDRIKPNINKSGKVLSTDSLKYPLQWYIDGTIDTNEVTSIDSAWVTGNYWVQAYDSVSGCVVNSDTVFVDLIGINEVNSGEHLLSIFPNPSTGKLYLRINVEGLEHAEIKIEDLRGQLVMNEYINCNAGCAPTLNIAHLSNGIYLLKLLNDESVITRKIVIQKE
jgi:hypothetical protein